jgi:hypothetical protein
MQELWKKKKRSNSSQQDKKGKRWLVAILQSHPNIPCLMPAPALSARLSVIASPPAFFIRQARYLCSETTETLAGPYTYTTGPLCPDIGKKLARKLSPRRMATRRARLSLAVAASSFVATAAAAGAADVDMVFLKSAVAKGAGVCSAVQLPVPSR